MASTSLGQAVVSIMADTSQLGTSLGKASKKFSDAGAADGERYAKEYASRAKKLASGFATGFVKSARAGAAGVFTAFGATMAYALGKGFARLSALDQADKKLKGLGHSAETVEQIMKNALASVKGTAFGLEEAATVSATAVAAGIKPGKELEATLKIVADTATIAGTSMADIGDIFTRVASKGKLGTEELNRLSERGIPAMQFLSKSMGVSNEEVRKLVTAGKVGFPQFQKAMEEGLGGAAQSSGETFVGAFANMRASLGRIGAGLLSGIFENTAPTLMAITKAMGPVEDAAKGMGKAISAYVVPAMNKLSAFLAGGGGGIFEKLKGIPQIIGPAAAAFAAFGASGLAPVIGMVPGLGGLATKLGLLGGPVGIIIAAFLGLVAVSPKLREALGGVFTALGDVGKQLLPPLQQLGSVVGPLVVGAVALLADGLTKFANLLAGSIIPAIGSFIGWLKEGGPVVIAITSLVAAFAARMVVLKVASLATAAATKVVTVATKAFAIAQWLVTAALKANPIGIVITLLAALVGGLIYAYKHSERFRAVVDAAWAGIKKAVAGTVDWIVNTAVPGVLKAWDWVASGAKSVWSGVTSAWNGIQSAVASVIGWFSSNVVPVFQAIWSGISKGASFVAGVVKTAFDGISKAFKLVASVISYSWNNHIKPIITGFANIVSWLWNTSIKVISLLIVLAWKSIGFAFKSVWNSIIKPVINALVKAWNWMAAKVIRGWKSVIQPVLNWLAGGFKLMWSVVKTVLDAIVRTWSKMAASVRAVYYKILVTIVNAFVSIVRFLASVFSSVIKSLVDKWNWLARIFRSVYDKTLKPVVGYFRSLISKMRESVNKGIGSVSSKWSSFANAFKSVYQKTITVVVGWFRARVSGLKGLFSEVVKNIGKTWDKLKGIVKAPIKFVVQDVLNGAFRKGYNVVAKIVGAPEMDKIELPKGFAKGGVLPGYTPGRDVHEFVSRTGGRLNLSGGEAIMVPQWTKMMGGSKAIERMNAAARRGQSFAKGGTYKPVPGGGNQHRSGYGWTTYAGDFPQPTGTPVRAWKDGIVSMVKHLTSSYGKHIRINHNDKTQSLYAHLSRTMVKVGQAVKGGQQIGKVGSTGNSTGPHLHFETQGGAYTGGKGGGIVGGIMDILGKLKDKFSGPLNKIMGKINDKFGNNPLAKMTKSAAAKLRDAAISKLKAMNPIGDLASAGKDIALKGVGAARWTPVILRALKMTGQSITNLPATLRRMKQESGFNPKAINNWDVNARNGTPSKGLMQVIQPTFDSFAGSMKGRGIWDPLANIYASMKYALSRYGSLAKAYNRPGGYANGTMNALAGAHMVGEHGPELAFFKGGERVVNAQKTSSLLNSLKASGNAQSFRGGGDSFGDINIELSLKDLEQLETIQDFLDMVKKSKGRGRRTARSGSTTD